MSTPVYSEGTRVAGPMQTDLFSVGGGSNGAALSISGSGTGAQIAIPSPATHDVTKNGNWAAAGVSVGMLVEGDDIRPNTYVDALSTTTMTLSRTPINTTGGTLSNRTMTFHVTAGGGAATTAKMSGVELLAGSNLTITPSTTTFGRPAYTLASTASGTGDVSAGSTFTTANVLMVCDGDDKTIDEPSGTITTNSQALTVGGALAATTGTFSGILKTDNNTAATSTTDGSLQTDGGLSVVLDAVIGDDIILISDASVIHFGVNSDVSLTHVHNTGLLLNSSMQLQFGDAGTYIHQSADGVLDLVSDTEIEINATTIDMNGNLELSGDITVSGNTVTFGNGAIFENSSSSLLTITEATTRVLGVASVHNTTTSSATEGGKLQLSADDGAAMADDHRLGVIEFLGAEDASNTLTIGARIEAICDAAWSATENGAALVMYTTDGNASQSEVLRLDSNKLATFAGAVTVAGDLTVSGTTTTVDSTTLTTADAMFSMGTGQTANNADALDFGFYGTYDVSGTQRYAGLLRDASDSGTFKFFSTTGGTHAEPTTTVNTTSGFTLAPVDMGALAATTGAFSSTLAATTGTFSGILKTDDTTDATSTTDGSLQTDGGLSVAKDGIFGNDLYLLNDSAVLGLGAGKDVTITHDGSTGATLASAGAFIIDCEADITLNANGGDILFADASASFGSITNSSGTMQIKAAAAKGIELRSNLGMTFLIEDDATNAAGVANIFQFTTEGLTGTDLTGVDNEMENVVCQYTSGSTVLGRTEFGKVIQDGSSGSNNTLFTFDSSVFSACEVLIHTKQGEAVSGDGLHQVNKMIVCAASMEGGGTDTVTFSNYSIIYSDGSTELASFTATISSDTVSVQFDATDNDVITYAVTFLA